MRGLILSELMKDKKNLIYIFLKLLVFAILAYIFKIPEMTLLFILYYAYIRAFSYLTRDSINNWEIYRLTFPISKAMIVKSKYYLIFSDILSFILFHSLTVIIFIYPIKSFDIANYLVFLYIFIIAIILLINILIYSTIKWGVTKTANFIILLAITFAYIIYKRDFEIFKLHGNIYIYFLGILFTFISTYIFYKNSVKIYKNRDL